MSRSLVLILLLALSSLELLQARSLPDRPHRRYIRRRVSPTNPDVEIVEVRDVYLIQRPKKVVTTIDEDELDWRIRCDFNPSLDECAPSTTSTTSTSSTTTTTTTTELPVLAESTEPEPEYDEEPEEETETQPETETKTETQPEPEEPDYEAQPNPEENIELEEDNGDDDIDGDEDEPEDADDDDTDTNNEEGSSFIGFNDQSEWN
ncbi:hypothetical protein KR059_009320 [Drosophila kikkawai]|nr:hypothetical protein KR059_009320 [Drosophila kikkawai]